MLKIENFEMHSDIEQGDPSSTNIDSTGIIEQISLLKMI